MRYKKGVGKVLVTLVLALVLLGLGVAMYMQFSGDATRGVESLMSCEDGVATGPLLAVTGGESAYCFENSGCTRPVLEEDNCPEGWMDDGECKVPEGSQWQSAGRVGCPDNNFCCVEVKNEGTTNNEEPQTNNQQAQPTLEAQVCDSTSDTDCRGKKFNEIITSSWFGEEDEFICQRREQTTSCEQTRCSPLLC